MRFLLALATCALVYAPQQQVLPNHNKAKEFNNRAIKLTLEQGRFEDKLERANRLLDSAILIDPNYVVARQNKLNNLITLKKYDLAISSADEILKRKSSIEIATAKAALLHKKGKNKEVKQVFDKEISMAIDKYKKKPSSTLLCNIALAYFLNGEKEKALNLLDTEKQKFTNDIKTKQQIEAFRKQLPSFTFDKVLNSYIRIKPKSNRSSFV
ncbi:tetratricopeptide repeat protein [Pedobacter sp.]